MPSTLWGWIGVVFLVAAGAAVGGCASVATTDKSAEQSARQFQPEPGMANLYLCRQAAIAGDTLVANTNLDRKFVGGLAPNTFLLISVEPGHHGLTVYGPANKEHVEFDAVAGQSYFFNVSITYDGPMIRYRHIVAISDADGRAAVNSESRAVGAPNPAESGQ
jgi:hypothetical protein